MSFQIVAIPLYVDNGTKVKLDLSIMDRMSAQKVEGEALLKRGAPRVGVLPQVLLGLATGTTHLLKHGVCGDRAGCGTVFKK